MNDYAGPTYDGVPAVGQHTREVLVDELGLAPGDVDTLASNGVVSGV